MRLAVVHALLLAAALAFAYQTWTRDTSARTVAGLATLWERSPNEIAAVSYQADDKTVVVERRSAGEGEFLWGTSFARRRPFAAAAQPAGADTAPGAKPAETVDTSEFLVGEEGKRLFEELATLRAVRDLGVVEDTARRREYGLVEPTGRIVIQFRDEARELEVGGDIYGSGDRYVLEPQSGRTYVVSGSLIRLAEAGDLTLMERRLHAFEADKVATVRVRSSTRERTMQRSGGQQFGSSVWTRPETPDQPDQTFANFMQRLEQLWISGYATTLDPSTLSLVVRVDYFGEEGPPLGYLELLKRTNAERKVEYYLRTELGRVLTRTYEGLAESVDKDVAQLF
ncbi:MAG: DUF4340 domain-containing protein [Gemmatimonadetes bacterium]|nr:DUF4340 domain-containing protein [Gemmatimonadota bacterium]